MISVITSFDLDYYNRIGRDCVESWLENWPCELKLTCYVEGFSMPHHERIDQIGFDQLSQEYHDFQASADIKPRVKTFAKKAYSIIHAMENLQGDRLIWLDADTITHAKVNAHDLDLCSDDCLATFMGVWHYRDRHDQTSPLMFSAETGFLILNTQHKGFKDFSRRYRQYYDQRLSSNLRRFYDGEVFGAVVQELQDRYKFRDLCRELAKSYNSPMKHTPVGRFLTHHKSKHSKDDYARDQYDSDLGTNRSLL